jgi:WD40 repeat protein
MPWLVALALPALASLQTAHDWRFLTGSTGPLGAVQAVAFAPDGARVAAGDNAGGVHVWNTAQGTPELALAGHAGTVNALAFSPDGAHLAIVGGSQRRGGGDVGFALIRAAEGGVPRERWRGML